jgi:hypothetical protein
MSRPNKTTSHPDKLPSVDNMTEEELTSILEWPPAFRSDLPVMYGLPARPVIKEQTIKALFDEALAREVLPELKVVLIGSELTAFPCVWGKLVCEAMYMDSIKQGRRARPIRFISLPGVNHFVSLAYISMRQILRFSRFVGSLGCSRGVLGSDQGCYSVILKMDPYLACFSCFKDIRS